MTKKEKAIEQAIISLLEFWKQRFPELDEWHESWLRKHSEVLFIKTGKALFYQYQEQENCYIVTNGLLVKEQNCDKKIGKQILSFAFPIMALFTTRHPYSNNSALEDIRSLRPSVIISIANKYIKPYRPQDAGIETLMNIFIHKKKSQKDMLHHLVLQDPPIQRCLDFAAELPEIYWNLSCTEQAAAMNVSLNTAKRARKKLMDG